MWMIRKTMPTTRHIHPTTIYAIPKKGFLPPKMDVCDSTTLLVPLNCFTLKSGAERKYFVDLLLIKLSYELTVINGQCVVSLFQSFWEIGRSVCVVVINSPVKLSKVWESGCSHPDNQIFVLQAIIIRVFGVQFPKIFLPIFWFCNLSFQNYTKKSF